METTQYIPYAEWVALASAVREKGLRSQEFERMRRVYPQSAGPAYDPMVYRELARLEEHLLGHIFRRFQREINRCLEEADIEIAETAIGNLKRGISSCLFFCQIPEYPEEVRKGMEQEIRRYAQDFRRECLEYMRRLERSDSSDFIQELAYLCRKRMADLVASGRGEYADVQLR